MGGVDRMNVVHMSADGSGTDLMSCILLLYSWEYMTKWKGCLTKIRRSGIQFLLLVMCGSVG